MEILIIEPNLLNVVLKNSSVIVLLPPTNMVIPLRGDSGVVSGELDVGGVVFEEDETKLLYKFCKHKNLTLILLLIILVYATSTVNFAAPAGFIVLSGISVLTGEGAENG
jgi:hypothetical protein